MTAADEQLARIAEIAPPPRVRIYKLQLGIDWWRWLCAAHLEEMLADEWAIRETKDVEHELACEECPRAAPDAQPTQEITT